MSDSGTNTPAPAGWYPDGQGGQRWWDGAQWGPVGQPPPYAPSAYAGAPGFPPPGPAPSGATSSGRTLPLLLAIIGGLVGVAVVVIVLVLTLGGSGESGESAGPSSDDPAETVAAFFEAARDGDCDAAVDLLTDDARVLFQVEDCSTSDPTGDFADITLEVGEPTIDGDDATVPVTASGAEDTFGAGELTIDVELLKTDGAWLIDGVDFDSLLEGLPALPDLSDLPSDFDPGELLSDLPSDFPSDFDPEDFLSDFPSDFPSDFLSDFPTDLLTDFPTE